MREGVVNTFVHQYHLILRNVVPNFAFWSFISQGAKPGLLVCNSIVMSSLSIIFTRLRNFFCVRGKIWITIFIISDCISLFVIVGRRAIRIFVGSSMIYVFILRRRRSIFSGCSAFRPPPRINPRDRIGRIAPEVDPTFQPNRIRTDEPPNIRIVEPERVVVQPRISIQVLRIGVLTA